MANQRNRLVMRWSEGDHQRSSESDFDLDGQRIGALFEIRNMTEAPLEIDDAEFCK